MALPPSDRNREDTGFWEAENPVTNASLHRRRSPRKLQSAPQHENPLDFASDEFSSIHIREDTTEDTPDDTFATPRASRTRVPRRERPGGSPRAKNFVRSLQNDTGPMPCLPPSSTSSRSSRSSARSSSPIKRGLDLQMLSKPVFWKHCTMEKMRTQLKDYPDTVDMIRRARAITEYGEGYLPVELRGELQKELDLDPERDTCFGKERPEAGLSATIRREAAFICRAASSSAPTEPQLRQVACRLSLTSELRSLREIVDATNDFKQTPRSEAAWNSRVHEAILQLAVKSHKTSSDERQDKGMGEDQSWLCWAAVENISRANIAKAFLPLASSTTVISSSNLPNPSNATAVTNAEDDDFQVAASKMIDFAIVLRPPPSVDMRNPQNKSLLNAIYQFVNSLPKGANFFNQTAYEPLIFSPSGVFVETKVDSRRYSEAQNQLGIWVASWYGRL
ncbi:hypothetical protein INS49_003974 [Diaporthe citri]|uniref:uncharacterized protein n=1 Tax=Diaporthe citri TaxID=83186 RepID=UPI001C7E49C5|nr:uncharacterized protein INS49_003974 [Diaporthe citri]KAG6354893.1 hypothetical protein INS49_003974 [Diaporthe citri]